MGFLSLDSPVGKFIARLFDLAILNILFLVTSIPIITIGSSITALYQVMLRVVKDEEGNIAKDYWNAWKENFKKAFLCFLPMLLIACVMLWNLYWYVVGYLDSSAMKITLLVGLFLLCMLGEWVFVWQAKFINTIKEIWHNAVFFTMRYFFVNLIFTALTLAWLYVMIFIPTCWIVAIALAFSLPAYLKSIFYRDKMQPFEDMIKNKENE